MDGKNENCVRDAEQLFECTFILFELIIFTEAYLAATSYPSGRIGAVLVGILWSKIYFIKLSVAVLDSPINRIFYLIHLRTMFANILSRLALFLCRNCGL